MTGQAGSEAAGAVEGTGGAAGGRRWWGRVPGRRRRRWDQMSVFTFHEQQLLHLGAIGR
jgi:hypothetical protein